MFQFIESGFSQTARNLNESITHGATANVAKLNEDQSKNKSIIDLSIGTLDIATDERINTGVIDFIKTKPATIHGFSPVKGFPFLLESVANRIKRLTGITYKEDKEIMVTPGGIKGSISVAFHTLLNPNDEVILPLPNWPHYADMIQLHGSTPVFVFPESSEHLYLTPNDLSNSITDKTKVIILGDCINPTGKVYSTEELRQLAKVIAENNYERKEKRLSPIYILFDCPYESHIFGKRAETFAALTIEVANTQQSMRPYTITVTGPGKTYGMHGDRLGYICADEQVIYAAARVQVNLNSFASTYAQVATHYALQEEMDEVASDRAKHARRNLDQMVNMLNHIPSVEAYSPEGSYFIFVNFSGCSKHYGKLGYNSADKYLLSEAAVATIGGHHFAKGSPAADKFNHYVRINCGRSKEVLSEAVERIASALSQLISAE
jgi:aspartate aminotransferase